jgi:hypothetical protein
MFRFGQGWFTSGYGGGDIAYGSSYIYSMNFGEVTRGDGNVLDDIRVFPWYNANKK